MKIFVKNLGGLGSEWSSRRMKMKKAALLAVCVAAFGCMCLQASTITVINPGFESDVLAPGGFTVGTFAAGWTCSTSNGCGAYRPGVGQFPGGVPDGVNIGFSNGGAITQSLAGAGSTLGLNMTYSLNVSLGKRLDFNVATPYLIELLAGTTVIAVDNSSLNPAAGTFLTSMLTYNSGSSNALAGQTLSILLQGTGTGQPAFDAVSLSVNPTSVPEPSAVALSLIGFALIGARKLRGLVARG